MERGVGDGPGRVGAGPGRVGPEPGSGSGSIFLKKYAVLGLGLGLC